VAGMHGVELRMSIRCLFLETLLSICDERTSGQSKGKMGIPVSEFICFFPSLLPNSSKSGEPPPCENCS
jgi:hypothetical protein